MAARWDDSAIAEAAAALRGGRLVAFPTETVYGLGARADDPVAVAALYAAKGRPRFNPLIAHVADLAAARAAAVLPPEAERLAAAFWPGPLTLVAPARPGGPVCDLARAGLPTVGVRAPAHRLAQALLAAVDVPVVAPSANRSGAVSPTTAAHVLDAFGPEIAGVLDGGACPVGIESTIVGFGPDGPTLLRPGGLPRETLEAALGGRLRAATAAGRVAAPGMLASHYAPGARLRLDAAGQRPGEAWLGFGADPVAVAAPALNLSPAGDLAEAAAALYAHLRALDAALGGEGVIAVAPIPRRGLGEAIADRLRRAAAPR